jgi:hypothetical protein
VTAIPFTPPASVRLLAELETRCRQLEEAKAELRQALAADYTEGAIRAARRLQSIGFLLGNAAREYELETGE